MPYAAEHKSRTRERIVDSARDLFNRKGFVDVSIDEIMARAGLTRGGFYGHFASKEDLFVEVVRAYEEFDPSARWHDIAFDVRAPANAFARQMVDAYLSRSHLDDVAGHCPMIALPSDVAHGTARVKQAYRALVERMSGVFAAGLAGDDDTARQRGLALTALCVGGMVLARTFDDDAFREAIRAATHALAAEIVDAGSGA
ncbi:TetR/AcrR family transcriptional regulator [Dokdonella sp.]|uniref:TetR/AcrR family transcriptional regulator n=1 Tax=Dokdonella sp. TaxID=2291710 RepID=UPI002F3EEAEA